MKGVSTACLIESYDDSTWWISTWELNVGDDGVERAPRLASLRAPSTSGTSRPGDGIEMERFFACRPRFGRIGLLSGVCAGVPSAVTGVVGVEASDEPSEELMETEGAMMAGRNSGSEKLRKFSSVLSSERGGTTYLAVVCCPPAANAAGRRCARLPQLPS
jgi:hypothetical protein